jgi:hypothetical protein
MTGFILVSDHCVIRAPFSRNLCQQALIAFSAWVS